MDEPRPAHDERVVALENERAALARALQNLQDNSHRFAEGTPGYPGLYTLSTFNNTNCAKFEAKARRQRVFFEIGHDFFPVDPRMRDPMRNWSGGLPMSA
jgi:hypothetical protein